MICSNCKSEADFVYEITTAVGVPYCNAHLPKFLEMRKKADLLKTTEEWESKTQEAVEAVSTPKKATVKKKAE